MDVEFIERIRDELKFDSLDALVAEMQRDKERARAILERRVIKQIDIVQSAMIEPFPPRN